jgi:hypothetical protein
VSLAEDLNSFQAASVRNEMTNVAGSEDELQTDPSQNRKEKGGPA